MKSKPPRLGSVALTKTGMCQRIGCANEGLMRPVIKVKSTDTDSDAELSMHIDLLVCPEHAITDVGAFIGEIGWGQLQGVLKENGKAPADEETARVVFERVKQ